VTLADALKIAAQAKPKPQHRQPLDKLQRGTTTVEQFTTGVTALAKSYDVMGSAVADMQKRIDQMRADLDHALNSPGQRRLQS
jgi:hypothetical protein